MLSESTHPRQSCDVGNKIKGGCLGCLAEWGWASDLWYNKMDSQIGVIFFQPLVGFYHSTQLDVLKFTRNVILIVEADSKA